MTDVEVIAVKSEASKRANESVKDIINPTDEVRDKALSTEFSKITGAPYPILSSPALVSREHEQLVERITREFIDRAKEALGIPKFDDGEFRLRPPPIPPAPMPTQPREGSREI